jgi:hypothetical protein
MRRKVGWPGTFDLKPLGGIWTIRRFDDVSRAASWVCGHGDCYYKASAMRVIDRVRIPAI